MRNFRTYQLAKELFHATQSLKVTGEVRDQLKRASLSIVLNLAEGSGKDGKDRVRFFKIAFGSLRETQALLDILNEKDLEAKADRLAAGLYNLIRNPGPGPAA
ncbi:MAG: four helix bundle protein [Bdellovibrionales bacterium]